MQLRKSVIPPSYCISICSHWLTWLQRRSLSICCYSNSPWRFLEPIGGFSSTLTVGGVYLGQALVSLLLLVSLYLYSDTVRRISSIRSYLGFHLVCTYVPLLSWPVYLYYTNALRQGVGLALTLIVVVSLLRYDSLRINLLPLVFLTVLAVLSHRSAILLLGFVFLLILITVSLDLGNLNTEVLSLDYLLSHPFRCWH